MEHLEGQIQITGRHGSERNPVAPGVATVKDGFVIFNFSVSGAGNVFKYDLTTQECEPMYYTLNDSLSGEDKDCDSQDQSEVTEQI